MYSYLLVAALALPTDHVRIEKPNWQPVTKPVAGAVQADIAGYPEYLRASVRIYNNGYGLCSGTIFAKGEKYAYGVTASHCFVGRIGGEFWVYHPDGTYSRATLLAHEADRNPDLALFRIAREDARGVCPVPDPESVGGGKVTAVGYSGGEGPKFKEAAWSGYLGREWAFTVESGTFRGGDSGGGIFLDNHLVAVIHSVDSGHRMICTPHGELYAWLRRHQDKLEASAYTATGFG